MEEKETKLLWERPEIQRYGNVAEVTKQKARLKWAGRGDDLASVISGN